jgi:hypothetical protein
MTQTTLTYYTIGTPVYFIKFENGKIKLNFGLIHSVYFTDLGDGVSSAVYSIKNIDTKWYENNIYFENVFLELDKALTRADLLLKEHYEEQSKSVLYDYEMLKPTIT